MIGLDTNVIVRYLVQDDARQSAQANHIIDKVIAAGETLWLSQITLCELVWVLERCYEIEKKDLINVLKKLLHTQQIKVEDDTVVRQALQDFESHLKIDFPDCLIGRQNISKGCSFTYTFDKNATNKLKSIFKLIK